MRRRVEWARKPRFLFRLLNLAAATICEDICKLTKKQNWNTFRAKLSLYCAYKASKGKQRRKWTENRTGKKNAKRPKEWETLHRLVVMMTIGTLFVSQKLPPFFGKHMCANWKPKRFYAVSQCRWIELYTFEYWYLLSFCYNSDYLTLKHCHLKQHTQFVRAENRNHETGFRADRAYQKKTWYHACLYCALTQRQQSSKKSRSKPLSTVLVKHNRLRLVQY